MSFFLGLVTLNSRLISFAIGVKDFLVGWTCFALCFISSFHGSTLEQSPIISNLTNITYDWVLGLIKPKPPLVVG